MEKRADIGAVFDEHVTAEFVHLDLEATMATMTDAPYVNHVPAMTGGVGREEVRRFYGEHFIGKWPAGHRDHAGLAHGRRASRSSTSSSSPSRTTSRWISFCRASLRRAGRYGSRSASWRGSRATSSPTSTSTGTRRRFWCRSGSSSRAGLPVTGAEQAENVLDPRAHPLNELMRTQG